MFFDARSLDFYLDLFHFNLKQSCLWHILHSIQVQVCNIKLHDSKWNDLCIDPEIREIASHLLALRMDILFTCCPIWLASVSQNPRQISEPSWTRVNVQCHGTIPLCLLHKYCSQIQIQKTCKRSLSLCHARDSHHIFQKGDLLVNFCCRLEWLKKSDCSSK